MKRLLFAFILCCAKGVVFSQNPDIAYPHVSVVSPEAASLAMNIDYPVSLYTGVPNIDIPLYKIDVDGFELPLTLSYHASGIRVDQEASWVGLGWTLDVGARISRVIKNVDDFLENGWDRYHPYCKTGWYDGPSFTYANEDLYKMTGEPSDQAWADLRYHLITDSEPDLFFYSLPSCSGKFIFDKKHLPVLFNKEHNLKVEVSKVGNPARIQLTVFDAEGNRYIFHDEEESRLYLANNALNRNGTNPKDKYDDEARSFTEWVPIRIGNTWDMDPGPVDPYPHTSCWCVSEIITNKNKVIDFNYEYEMQYLPTQESCEIYNSTKDNKQSKLFTRSKTINKALHLKSISWTGGKVEFKTSNREDIKGSAKKIDGLTLHNVNGDIVGSVSFHQSYFNDDYEGDYPHVFKRLRLDSLSLRGVAKGYEFDYFDGSLPPKNTKNVDYWGYPNGREYGDDYCVGVYVNGTKYKGVKKNACLEKSQVGTLSKIKYPTGGTSEFTYENHIFSTTFDNVTNNDLAVDSTSRDNIGVSYRREDICVYNNYSMNEYPDSPSDSVWRFEIPVKTSLKIEGVVENTNCSFRDPNYIYYSDPLGEFCQIINGRKKKIYTYVCPHVYLRDTGSSTNYNGEGDEITLAARTYTLEPGTYEFHAYTPPKDVYATWSLFFDYQSPLRTTRYMVAEEGAGLRIASIKNDAYTKIFHYSMGTHLTEPLLFYYGNRVGDGTSGSNRQPCLVQVSESKAPLSTFNNGNSVGYDWVMEEIVGDDNPSQIKHYYMNEAETEVFDDNFVESPVIINYTNGLQTKVEYSEDDQLVATESYEYGDTYSDYVYAFIDRNGNFGSDDVLNYYYKVRWPQKSHKVETQVRGDKEISSEEKYTYNAHGLVSQISKSANGDVYQTIVRYPFDAMDAVGSSMTQRNLINVPMEIVELKNGSVIGARRKECVDTLNMFLAKAFYTLSTSYPLPLSSYSSCYHKQISFDRYDAWGNLVQSTENGLRSTYLWGYGSQYPLAVISNADYNTVYALLGGKETVYSFASKPVIAEAEAKSFLSPILNGKLKGAAVTMYLHSPMVGVLSISTPYGDAKKYKYDTANRLNFVYDSQNYLLDKYSYNYKW